MKPIQLFITAATVVAVSVQPASSVASEAEVSESLIIGWKTSVFPVIQKKANESTSTSAGKRNEGSGHSGDHKLEGFASYYGKGLKTASGEAFDKRAMTAAHPTLPFNSIVRVTERDSGKSVVVRINDRGPFVPGRVIDLSEAAAEALGLTRRGLTAVRLEVLSGPEAASALNSVSSNDLRSSLNLFP